MRCKNARSPQEVVIYYQFSFSIPMVNVKKILSAVLLFLMLVFEARYYLLKIIILFILLIMNMNHIYVSRRVFMLYVPLCLSTLVGIFGGLIRGYDHAFYGITTGIIWPFASLFFAAPMLLKQDNFKYFIKILFYVHSFLVLYDLGYAFSIIVGFSFPNIYPEIDTLFSFYGFTSRMNFTNLNVLTYTIPIFFMIWLSKYEIGISRLIQTSILLLSFFLLILSGRRSLMIVFPLAPIVALFVRRQLPTNVVKKISKYIVLFISILSVFIFYFYFVQRDVFDGYLFTFTKAFDSDEEPVKFIQAKQLLDVWKDYPLFGAGTGMKLYESIRGIWKFQFELTYLFILASRGVVGFILYLFGVIGPLFVGFKLARKHDDQLFIFMLIGYFFILLADATNPVLCSFDLMVPLYMCYAKINSIEYNKNRTLKYGNV